MKGSRVSAKMAGTESSANTMSVASRQHSATSSGVATSRPPSRIRKRGPWKSAETGRSRRSSRRSGLRLGSMVASEDIANLRPVTIRNVPKSHTTQWNCISTEPSAMNTPRNTSAPRMP
jgi:hypothetical protein